MLLSFQVLRSEGDLRFDLVRVRENAGALVSLFDITACVSLLRSYGGGTASSDSTACTAQAFSGADTQGDGRLLTPPSSREYIYCSGF